MASIVGAVCDTPTKCMLLWFILMEQIGEKLMTEQDYKSAIKSLMITIVVGAVLIYGFFVLGFIYDIH